MGDSRRRGSRRPRLEVGRIDLGRIGTARHDLDEQNGAADEAEQKGDEQNERATSRTESSQNGNRRWLGRTDGDGGHKQRTGGHGNPKTGSDTMLGIDKLYSLGAKGHNI
jgi:hypothetical protein